MPGPPTPISECPLKQLEIRSGTSASQIYGPHSSISPLTLTIEAQRDSPASDTATLVLVVHNGSRRMLCLRLTDLLESEKSCRESVGVIKIAKQLTIRVLDQGYTVIACFEESRDFNVAVCMLQKTGFFVTDESCSNSATGSLPRTPSLTLELDNSQIAPRLSSITPIHPDMVSEGNREGLFSRYPIFGHISAMPSSYATLPLPCSGGVLQGPSDQIHNLTPLTPYSSFVAGQQPSMLSQPSSLAQLNPYNVFYARQNSDLHRPRISSPLRNTVQPDQTSQFTAVPSASANLSQEQVLSNRHASMGFLTEGVTPTSYSSQNTSLNSPVPETTSTVITTLKEGSPASPQNESIQPNSPQDFRDLMPRRRDLPFLQRTEPPDDKDKPVKSKAAQHMSTKGKISRRKSINHRSPRRQPAKVTLSKDKYVEDKLVNGNPVKDKPIKDRLIKDKPTKGNPTKAKLIQKQLPAAKTAVSSTTYSKSTKTVKKRVIEEGVTPRKSKRLNASKSSPIQISDINSTVDHEVKLCGRPADDRPQSVALPPEPRLLDYPMCLIFADTLRELNELTSRYLDQYEIDIAQGRHKAAIAQYYVDKIASLRKEFWIDRLYNTNTHF